MIGYTISHFRLRGFTLSVTELHTFGYEKRSFQTAKHLKE